MIELRPQPIGLFASPADGLLLPKVMGCETCHVSLLQGDLSGTPPKGWEFFYAAARGDVAYAWDLMQGESSQIAEYNRFILRPDASAYAALRSSIDGPLARLLDAAAYSQGLRDAWDDESAVRGDASLDRELAWQGALESDEIVSLDGELLAWTLAAAAAADLERRQLFDAKLKLKSAVEASREASPLLTAVLLGQYAELTHHTPGFAPALVIQHYREAIQLANQGRLPLLAAHLSMNLGMAYQQSANGQRGALLEAVNAYQAALHGGLTADEHPELFAQLQNNLGIAYLSMPAVESSNQLRIGVAIQSFRHALTVYDRERHPDMWASVSMNLANALQYAPSSHPEENLQQAVRIYEEVLQVRVCAKDPCAYALTLLNQANALAHLGAFKPSLEKAAEAYRLFTCHDFVEQAEAALELLDQINLRREELRVGAEGTLEAHAR
ncbi:MAG: hypothetical protein KDA61_01160 [Planctomycetales bacterium]|nr:hypothetical protein [Planctomycetales bacterium]